jgi:hypothetical protein
MHVIMPDPQPPADMPRSLHEICDDARRGQCGLCCALRGDECVYTTGPVSLPVTSDTPMRGYHVARFAWAEANRLISAADFALVLETVAADPFTNATVIYDTEQAEDRNDVDDGLEPYCTECGALIGMFLGMEGWHHYRGQGTSASPVEIYDAGHEAAVAWCEPPGRSLSPADVVTICQALADAEACRRSRVEAYCYDCQRHPAGACEDHLNDLDQADAYRDLAQMLPDAPQDER